MRKKILVTGGSGFVGGYVYRYFRDKGSNVINFDLYGDENDDSFVKGSILDREAVEKITSQSDVIFHFAGFSNINKVKDAPVDCLEANIMSTAFFLDSLKNTDNLFVYASSVYVNDENGHFYTTSKHAAERVCKNYHELFNQRVVILRLGTVYGEYSRHEDVVSLFVQKALKGDPLTIHGDGSQVRHFIHGADIARACQEIADFKENKCFKKLILAGVEEVSIEELAERVRQKIPGTQIKYLQANERCSDYRGAIQGREETYEFLKWKPEIGIDKGIDKLIKHFTL